MTPTDVILYVEDDIADVEIMQHVLKQGGFQHRLIHVASGVEAKAYLEGIEQFGDRTQFPLPGLIMADLKLPGMSGMDLLQWVRLQAPDRLVPFVILTGSEDLKQVSRAYLMGANSFLIKPPTAPDLAELFKGVGLFSFKPRSS